MRSGAGSPAFKWRNRRLVSKNLRKFVGIKPLPGRTALQKPGHPEAVPSGSLLDGGAIDAAPALRKSLQFLQSGVEEAQRARVRAALDMVIGRRQLDESLQENMNVRLGLEPYCLPRLVRIPEFGGVEVIEPGAEMGDEVRLAQSSALVPRRNVSHIAVVKSAVVPEPPMSRVRCSGPESSTLTIASSIRFAGPISPMC